MPELFIYKHHVHPIRIEIEADIQEEADEILNHEVKNKENYYASFE